MFKTSPMGWNSWDCYGAAVNEAQRKASQDAEESMGKVTGGMNMPGMF